jgi:predicted GNAT superfamily acetyltransferase
MVELNIDKNKTAKKVYEAMVKFNKLLYATIKEIEKSKTFIQKKLEEIYTCIVDFKDTTENLLPK